MLGRAIGVLDAFQEADQAELTLSELADRADLPLTTTHRLAGQLVSERMLERSPSGLFRIGSHLQELGSLAAAEDDVVSVARPYLEDLAEATGRVVQLIALDGPDAVVVDVLGAPESLVGARTAAHATGGGLVLLAHASEEQTREALDQPLEQPTDTGPISTERIRTAMDVARRQGHLEVRARGDGAAISVSAPVLVDAEAPVAVAVVGAPAGAPSVVPAVLTTTRGIARALGAPRTGAIPIVVPGDAASPQPLPPQS